MRLVGLPIDEAKAIAQDAGYEVEIIDNNSDKMKTFDTTLVTNAVVNGDKVKLTISNFLLNIKE